MPGWEYIKLDLNDLRRNTQEIDLLNDAGRDGWELAILQNGIAYMKRPVRTAPARRSVGREATSDDPKK